VIASYGAEYIFIFISRLSLILAGIYSYSYSYPTHIPTDSARAGFIFIYRLAVSAPYLWGRCPAGRKPACLMAHNATVVVAQVEPSIRIVGIETAIPVVNDQHHGPG
jgi:hypothetical protein